MSLVVRNLSLRSHSNITKFLNPWFTPYSRTYSTRKDCPPYEDPKCAKEYLEKQPPCHEKLRRIELGETNPPKINSMWENPECCIDPCPDYSPRLDELYYKISDKLKRKYQQTWVGCPKMLKKKKCCDLSKAEYPVFEKRDLKHRPKTACEPDRKLCMIKKATKCPRVTLMGCPSCRIPPKCIPKHNPRNCKKECTPYPSFSECMRDLPLPLHPVECKCLTRPMMCEIWAEMRRRMTFRS